MVEQSYSLHGFLNKITRVDKIMFSDVFQDFLAKTEGTKTESCQTENTSNLNMGNKTGKPFILFEIVSAKNVTEGDKKIMLYTIMMKKHLLDNHPVFLKRRYSDFYNLQVLFQSVQQIPISQEASDIQPKPTTNSRKSKRFRKIPELDCFQ